jgi:nitronate monooxygenase
MNRINCRVAEFCNRHRLGLPILLAPMSGACPPALSIAVMSAGGLGACGALPMSPNELAAWAREVRSRNPGPFQINLWIPDPPPLRELEHESRVREFLRHWGPPLSSDAGNATPPDFAAQCEALLAVEPPIVSSVMGLYPERFVERLKAAGISWFANVTTVAEAQAAEAAGADAVVAQGAEAGGHRGCFEAAMASQRQVGLFSLLPAVVDAVKIPVVATGGIADGRGIAAALILGASAVQIGTGFLRCPQAAIHPAWANALAQTAPEDTLISSVFSGRAGRSIATSYVKAATADDAPKPAPYPVQRSLTSAMRAQALNAGDVQRMQAWAGQSARLAQAKPAADLTREIWEEARRLMNFV